MGEQPKSALEEAIGDVRASQSSYSEDDWREKISNFLASQGEHGRITELKRPDGGASAASVIFSLASTEEGKTTEQRYVARLKPDSSFWATFDTVEQFTVQCALHKAGLPVPAALWLDEHGEYLGRPGYIMAFATGEASTPAYFSDGPMSNIDTDKRFRMMSNMIGTLADFHAKAKSSDVPSLATKGRGDSFIERELNMWFDLIDHARPEVKPYYEPVRQWLVDTAPDVPNPVLLHGDYQGSNVLWQGEEISAILDFEISRIGPPESDVAYQCNMDEIGARFYGGLDIDLPSMNERAAWYEQKTGVKLANLDYHYLRAMFQLACGMVGLAGGVEADLSVNPTPIMDYMNRRVLALLPESFPFEPKLPIDKTEC